MQGERLSSAEFAAENYQWALRTRQKEQAQSSKMAQVGARTIHTICQLHRSEDFSKREENSQSKFET
jgi:hypothetical protein